MIYRRPLRNVQSGPGSRSMVENAPGRRAAFSFRFSGAAGPLTDAGQPKPFDPSPNRTRSALLGETGAPALCAIHPPHQGMALSHGCLPGPLCVSCGTQTVAVVHFGVLRRRDEDQCGALQPA